jgi:probable rRNA maturation factor
MTAPSRPAASISVAIRARGWRDAVDGPVALCRRAARAALDAVDAPPGAELAIALADDDFLQGLNRDWRGIDAPTNVLSFPTGDEPPAPEAPVMLGDIAIALQTTAAEAARDRLSVADHLAHLVVHGVLHLLGYDHEIDAEAEIMETEEARILTQMGIENPYAPDHAAKAR